ncbi:MAG: FprA family A-type flavoprotein [Muribaculaceae bacterium]|nr:FprA family A-type flavoprotein [Muribaculaceae bacterium]
MRLHRISAHINYIGVNDRTTERFETLWPLPHGVSYNSYLVTGSDKTAIIDGVEVSHALQQIDAIKSVLGDRNPDYLIINHMEPDHSGAIRILRQAFPELTIVGNVQTLAMVKGFYGVADNFLTVKDGDTLSLGDVTLRFALTPMVHWPETMMTYFEEEKTLLSGDAFGCFGALNGAVVDKDMDTTPYFPEMIRYYSNIVGKYGQFVQRAMAKLKDITVETICSTHGPVWQAELSRVIDLYDRLSRYEPLDRGVTIVYGSMYGNTERMVEATADALVEAGVRNISVHNAAKSDLSYILADLFTHAGVIFASPTYSDSVFPPVAAALDAAVLRGLKNREVAVIGEFTWAPMAAKKIGAAIEASEMNLISDPITAKHAPDADILDKCRALATALAEKIKA